MSPAGRQETIFSGARQLRGRRRRRHAEAQLSRRPGTGALHYSTPGSRDVDGSQGSPGRTRTSNTDHRGAPARRGGHRRTGLRLADGRVRRLAHRRAVPRRVGAHPHARARDVLHAVARGPLLGISRRRGGPRRDLRPQPATRRAASPRPAARLPALPHRRVHLLLRWRGRHAVARAPRHREGGGGAHQSEPPRPGVRRRAHGHRAPPGRTRAPARAPRGAGWPGWPWSRR